MEEPLIPKRNPERMVRQVRKKGIRPIRRRFGEEQLDAHAGIYDASQWSRRHRRRSSRGNSNAVGSAGRERETAAAFIPEAFVAESLVAGLGDVAGRCILLPHAELAREVLADELRQRGATVDEIAIYRTLPAAPDPNGLAELQRGVNAITFTSSSTVRNFAALLRGSTKYIDAANSRRMGHDGIPMPSLNRAIIACIGPI